MSCKVATCVAIGVGATLLYRFRSEITALWHECQACIKDVPTTSLNVPLAPSTSVVQQEDKLLKLEPGTAVVVTSSQKPEIDGKLGMILAFDDAKGKYRVALKQSSRTLALRPSMIAPVEVPAAEEPERKIPAPTSPATGDPTSCGLEVDMRRDRWHAAVNRIMEQKC